MQEPVERVMGIWVAAESPSAAPRAAPDISDTTEDTCSPDAAALLARILPGREADFRRLSDTLAGLGTADDLCETLRRHRIVTVKTLESWGKPMQSAKSWYALLNEGFTIVYQSSWAKLDTIPTQQDTATR